MQPITGNDIYIHDHSLENGTDIVSILKKYNNPILVFSGHYHVSKIIHDKNIVHISSPSLITYPNAFRVISLNRTDSKVKISIKTLETNLKNVQQKSKELLDNNGIFKGSESDNENLIIISL